MAVASLPLQAKEYINQIAPGFRAKIAIELGSGLGDFADKIESPIIIPYSKIPGFPVSEVEGHANKLVLGTLNSVPIMCLHGRVHGYEGAKNLELMKVMLRTMRLCGAEIFVATNASGSFFPHMPPGSIVLIRDHINFSQNNPLLGPNDDEYGPRFVAMDNCYDQQIRELIKASAEDINLPIHEGIYFGVQGPCFETPAEIRAYRSLGAEVIGMSTVPDVIIARHCGMKVAVISVITNFTSDINTESLSHEGTLFYAGQAAAKLTALIVESVKKINQI